jgi:hypothetical protein
MERPRVKSLGRSRSTNAWKKRALLIMRMERSAETHQRASYSKDDDNDFTNSSTFPTDLDNTHDPRDEKVYTDIKYLHSRMTSRFPQPQSKITCYS